MARCSGALRGHDQEHVPGDVIQVILPMTNKKPLSIATLVLSVFALFTGWLGIAVIALGPVCIVKEGRNGWVITGIALGIAGVLGLILCTIF